MATVTSSWKPLLELRIPQTVLLRYLENRLLIVALEEAAIGACLAIVIILLIQHWPVSVFAYLAVGPENM